MPDIFVAEGNEPVDTPPVETGEEEKLEAKKIPQKQTKEQQVGVFQSYCPNPKGILLKNELPEDEILLFLRRHFITNIPWIIQAIALFLLPIFLLSIFGFLNLGIELLPPLYTLYVILLYYFVVLLFAFLNFVTWFFNISFVTTQRIVDIDFKSLVYKNVAATKVGLIEDVSYHQVGVVRSIFNYGDVLIQTAGETENFDFHAVPHPEKVVSIVEDLMRGGKH